MRNEEQRNEEGKEMKNVEYRILNIECRSEKPRTKNSELKTKNTERHEQDLFSFIIIGASGICQCPTTNVSEVFNSGPGW
jgi:hypothetical protein